MKTQIGSEHTVFLYINQSDVAINFIKVTLISGMVILVSGFLSSICSMSSFSSLLIDGL